MLGFLRKVIRKVYEKLKAYAFKLCNHHKMNNPSTMEVSVKLLTLH